MAMLAMVKSHLEGSKQARHARDKVLGPTLERQAKGDGIRREETRQAGQVRTRVETQTFLDRYHKRGQISRWQYDAGSRLHRVWVMTGGLVRVTSSWAVRIDNASGNDPLVRQHAAFERIEKTLRYVGRQLSPVVVAVCIMDNSARDWARAQDENPDAGMFILRLGLDRLGESYRRSKHG